jgi:putative MATE family efflux protein
VGARATGAGHDRAAAGLAVQALWVALGIGAVLVVLAEVLGGPVLHALGGHGRSGHFALVYLRIAAIGLPSALVALAGQGYLRGVSDLRRPLWIVIVGNAVNVVLEVLFVYGFHWGIAGAAAGTAVAQTGMGLAFVRELLLPPADTRRPRLAQMRPLVRVGRQIFVRTTALYASFLVAASVLARMGDAEIGAHQIAFQLFVFLALILDAVAIAAQVIVGRMLGAGDDEGANEAARRMILWSTVLGLAFGLLLLPLGDVVPRAFTDDPAVLDRAREIWPLFALMQPLGGAVFALDGILIGASDTSYLMWSMLAAGVLVYIPIALVALAAGWGIIGVWSGLVALMLARLTLLGARFVGRRWAVVGWA